MARLGILERVRSRARGESRAGTGRTPVPFVVGAPRSGTTMLRLMLDAHPDLAIPPETYFIPKSVKAWRHAKRPPVPRSPLDAYIETVTEHKRWPDFHLDADEYRQRLREQRPRHPSAAIRAFYELYAEKAGKQRWGDKTPFYVRKMRIIHKTLPEARFIHLIRDGRGVALSIKDLWFGPDTIEGCAEFWIERLDQAREQAAGLPHYIEVRYEDLVRDPEPHLRRICEFAELPYDERMLRYYEQVPDRVASEVPPQEVARDGRLVATEERLKIMENVSKPPDPSRIDRWKTDMDDDDRRRFERIAGSRLRELGYPVES